MNFLQMIKNDLQKDLKFEPTTGGFNVTNTSFFSGKTRTQFMRINIDQIEAWQSGTLIQKAFPQLDASQREFILSGATDEEWNTLK